MNCVCVRLCIRAQARKHEPQRHKLSCLVPNKFGGCLPSNRVGKLFRSNDKLVTNINY